MAKLKAVVQFDYNAEASDELTLRVGDVLMNIKTIEEGWCQGTLNGKTGMFPDNFVKIEEDKPLPKPASTKPPQHKKKPEYIRKMKVTFAYDPQNEDELALGLGEIIEVILDEEEGWAQGRLNGRTGVFPTNFAENVEEESPPPAAVEEQQPNANTEEVPQNQPVVPGSKKVKGVGFGNIFGDGPIKLRQSSIGETETDKQPAQKAKVTVKEKKEEKLPPVPPATKKAKVVERCRATFDYDATTDDELTLIKGDIVFIINKHCADAGWWEGEIVDDNGRKRRGVFPDNFVTLLPSVDEEADEKTSSKESLDSKQVENKPKAKQTEPEPAKAKSSPAPVNLKINNSLKRPAPQAPPSEHKPSIDENNIDAGLSLLSASPVEEKQLTHYKRASGPKNRRKPDSVGRRERAKETSEDSVINTTGESIDLEPEPAETEITEPQVTPKRETKRGIQVMPSPTGGTEGGDTPGWLKNLKNRSSQKRESAPLSVPANKVEENANEAPDWRANLRKKPKPGEAKATSPVAPKPAPHATSPKPVTQSLKLAASFPTPNHAPARPPSPDKSTLEDKGEKTWVFKKNMKSKSEPDVLASTPAEVPMDIKTETKPAMEIKKPPAKPTVALQPPKQLELPGRKPTVAGSKPKPPPPKAKPALPGAKPLTSASAPAHDDVKEDLKALKESFSQMQAENRKEINRLSNELEEERRHRISLQAEVAQLRKEIG